MHEFIQTVASRLAHAGSASRAQTIFDQAMNRGQYRWGRKAKLTAGASVAIALREARKSDALHDIAYLLEEHMAPISRAFSSVISLLQLGLASADPSMHFSALQCYLHSLVQDPTSSLSPKLLTTLRPLMAQLPTVMCTAKSLANLLSRSNTLSHLPTPPTACALMLLALEGELRSSIPNASALADALSKRLGVGKGVVMQRYKVIYDLIEEWIREVPWLQAHERKKGGTGRSKVAKRVVVARGLKDVVQFQEEIWNKKLEDQARPHLVLDIDDEEDKEDDDSMSSQLSTEAENMSRALRCPRFSLSARSRLVLGAPAHVIAIRGSKRRRPGSAQSYTYRRSVKLLTCVHVRAYAPTTPGGFSGWR